MVYYSQRAIGGRSLKQGVNRGKMRTIFKNKLFKILLIVILIAAVLTVLGMSLYGSFEIIQFNSNSITDWRLDGSVEGISSPEEGERADIPGFFWFEDEDGSMGLQASDGTRYYMGYYPNDSLGRFHVVGFGSSEKVYSVLDIRVGDSITDATTQLMNCGYSMDGGGLNICKATKGHISVIISFEHGYVTHIEASLDR